ncbi:ATP-NAD kinase [Auriculariales sp. MPI-PUGE-AT-0066]|nr:ATP-NAD kinase [Auriculariales sp. MPI-PUGE-AT-0066]
MMNMPMSPIDASAFSTPPTTPRPPETTLSQAQVQVQAALRRRNSRPTSLTIPATSEEQLQGLVVEHSPDQPRSTDTVLPRGGITNKLLNAITVPSAPKSAPANQSSRPSPSPLGAALHSPCFVHSGLDKAAALSYWLRSSKPTPPLSSNNADAQPAATQPVLDHRPSVPPALPVFTQPFAMPPASTASSSRASTLPPSDTSDLFDDEDDDSASSLTRQLAETATSVREMSKALGRARVKSNIQSVLIITKARDNRLIKLTRELALYLMLQKRQDTGRGLVVYVDTQLRHSKRFDAVGIQREYPDLFRPFLPKRRTSSSIHGSSTSLSGFATKTNGHNIVDEGQLRYWTNEMCTTSPHLFDFVVTLGGDGTVLYASWLFQRIVPPILPFALGSLGFLTNFDFSDHKAVMDGALDSGIRVNLRMRFTCTVYRAIAPVRGKGRKAIKKGDTGEIMMRNVEKDGWEALEGGYSGLHPQACKDKEIMCYTTRPVETFEILNDLVVDRGPSPYVSLLELFGDEHHMTTVQADGLCVATPTGSTAYSLSAGGSLVMPEIPAMCITPLCPHTLSFRPMLLPDTMELRICVPYNSRSTAWASFDGRGRIELKQGDHIKVTASKYPFPTVCADMASTDWFHSISRTLKWNERERQKSFVVVEEGPAKAPSERGEVAVGTQTEEEEEEETYDIDDISGQSTDASNTGESSPNTPPPQEEEKDARVAAAALSKGIPQHNQHVYGTSGVDSPDRFGAGHRPHAPPLSSRHARFADDDTSAVTEVSGEQSGTRDDIHSGRVAHMGSRSRIPRDRDVDADSMKTPRAFESSPLRRNDPGRRAFAVWGHDESDSNASDSDTN